MLRLLKYELKKFFSHKILFIIFAIIIILNVWLITKNITNEVIESKQNIGRFIDDYNKDPDAMEEYITNFNKQFNAAQRIKAMGEKPVYPENKYTSNDYNFFSRQKNQIIDFKSSYQKTIKNSLRIAEAHKNEYEHQMENNPNIDFTFDIAYQEKVIENYSDLVDMEFPIANIVGYDILFFYDGFGVFTMIAMIIGGMLVFIPDETSGMTNILRVSKKGRTQTIISKLLVAFVYCVVIWLILNISAYLAVGYKIGYSGFSAPIQMVTDSLNGNEGRTFVFSPFKITVGEGLLLSALLRLFASFTFMIIIIALSCVFSSYAPSLILGFVFTGVNYIFANYNFLNDYDFFKNVNFFWCINGLEPIIYWKGINIFGNCIPAFDTTLILYSILIAVSILVIFLFYIFNKGIKFTLINKLINKISGLFSNKKKLEKHKPHKIFIYELKKIFSIFVIVVLIILFGLNVFLSITEYNRKLTSDEKIYVAYFENLEGVWTEEKHEYITGVYTEMSDIINSKSEMDEKYKNKEVQGYLYFQYITKFESAKVQIGIVRNLVNVSNNLKELNNNGNSAYFVNEIGWKLAKNTNFSYIYLIAIIFVFGNIFAIEYKDGTLNIQSMTKNYNRVTGSKIILTILLTFFIILIGELTQYSLIISFKGLSSPLASTLSTSLFDEGVNIPIFVYFLLQFLKQVLVGITFALFVLLISKLTRRLLPTLAISSVISFAPLLLSYFGYNFLDGISLIRLVGRS